MSFGNKGRKIQPKNGKTFPKSSGNVVIVEDDTFTSVISKTLRAAFGRNGAAVKSLMRITDTNERTVRNWLEGKNAPNGENLIELLRHSDEVLEAVLLMAERNEILVMKTLTDIRGSLGQMIKLIDELVAPD